MIGDGTKREAGQEGEAAKDQDDPDKQADPQPARGGEGAAGGGRMAVDKLFSKQEENADVPSQETPAAPQEETVPPVEENAAPSPAPAEVAPEAAPEAAPVSSGFKPGAFDASQYDLRFEVSAFLNGSRVQTSQGQLGPQGLSPKRFSDKSRSERAAPGTVCPA